MVFEEEPWPSVRIFSPNLHFNTQHTLWPCLTPANCVGWIRFSCFSRLRVRKSCKREKFRHFLWLPRERHPSVCSCLLCLHFVSERLRKCSLGFSRAWDFLETTSLLFSSGKTLHRDFQLHLNVINCSLFSVSASRMVHQRAWSCT